MIHTQNGVVVQNREKQKMSYLKEKVDDRMTHLSSRRKILVGYSTAVSISWVFDSIKIQRTDWKFGFQLNNRTAKLNWPLLYTMNAE